MPKKNNSKPVQKTQFSFDFTQDVNSGYKQTVLKDIYGKTKKGFRSTAGEFIKWMGGKTSVAKDLASMLHKIPHTYFVDCFIGGGAEFFAKNKAKFNIINDKNDNLINLYEQVRNNLDDLMVFLYNTFRSHETFLNWRKLYNSKNWSELSNIERAGIYYYLISHSVNSDETIMGYSHLGSSTKSGRNTFGNDAFFATLIRARNKLQGVQIYNKEFSWIVKKYNIKSDKEKRLFFFDPPYYITNDGRYYKESANTGLHNSLVLSCREIDKNENIFFITYDNVPQIRSKYKDYNIVPFEIHYGSNNTKATEIIITNSNFDKQMDFFA